MLNHEILISKLEYYGLHDLSIQLFKSYLSNMKQYVEIDESDSDMLCLTISAPQGSILYLVIYYLH